ncbi:MAG: AraC family transcriptional regulator [Acidimicrobiales bacterium]
MARRPEVPGVSEVFHARIFDYGYPTHAHDTWTVLIVDSGAISYELDRRPCGAEVATVAILPPGVTHNGKPAPGAPGFTKRVLYLDESFLPIDLVGAAVDQTNIADRALRRALVEFHEQLLAGADHIQAESSLAMIADRITRHLERNTLDPDVRDAGVAQRLRLLLDDSQSNPITLAQAAAQLDRSKPHLVRSFRAAYGVTPHAYLIGKRVEAGRKLLLDGMPPAEVAHAVGFYDQAHFSKHFKRHTSIPPGAYAHSHPANLPAAGARWTGVSSGGS